MQKTNQAFEEIIKYSDNIVFFGGAGVSTASGIPDFRSNNGLYSTKYGEFSPEMILSSDFFYELPEEFYKFYREKMVYTSAKPNAVHKVLARLEKLGKLKGVITQNIDGLHQQAGSENVIELHGSIFRYKCNCCGEDYSLQDILKKPELPVCECGNVIKPQVVLYGEPLSMLALEKARTLIENAETLIVGGTSLSVYPASKLVEYFSGKNLIIINKTKTPYDSFANLNINDDINKVFESLGATLENKGLSKEN